MAGENLTPALRRKGGRATRHALKSRTVEAADLPGALTTLEDCSRWTAWVAVATATGEIDRTTGAVILKAISLQKVVTEKLDLGRELTELRAQLAALKAAP